MTDKCRHIPKVKLAADHSILNPEKWLCVICGTTESVWACLSCSNVACGRYTQTHALQHYQESKHPISIEVNEKYVYCYECNDYALNDNAAGDLKLLRSALSAITTQSFEGVRGRGRRILRSRSFAESDRVSGKVIQEEDKFYTALIHRRLCLLSKVFYAWRQTCPSFKSLEKTPDSPSSATVSTVIVSPRKPTVLPGVTGLRNLGNTCYMNSILQVLGHLREFLNFFLTLNSNFIPANSVPSSPSQSESSKPTLISHQTTVECFKYVTTPHQKGGLNGGSTRKCRQRQAPEKQPTTASPQSLSLCRELHALFRVMWSGKWALLSPNSFLHAVWDMIPNFKGFAQQDAQEFLCELLDKVQYELGELNVGKIFSGEIISQVTCQACGHKSISRDPFMDLSLEFPDRYQINENNKSVCKDNCHVTEMLDKFTKSEDLEPSSYACDNCNAEKTRQSSDDPVEMTNASKRLQIGQLPQVLRLHLKRFRWVGRNHREKIATHVDFSPELDMSPYCESPADSCMYVLCAVVIHHGRGFGSGHYTSYVYCDTLDQWILCNDTRLCDCAVDEVLKCQAYILFYTKANSTSAKTITPGCCDLNLTPINNQTLVEIQDQGENSHSNASKDSIALQAPIEESLQTQMEESQDVEVDADISFNKNSYPAYIFKRKNDDDQETSGTEINKRRKTC